jgi:tetratricopeptide (TPR) repeat protein
VSGADVFVLGGDTIEPYLALGATHGGAAALFGASSRTTEPASTISHELAALVRFVRGTGQPPSASLLVLPSPDDLDHPQVRPWLLAAPQRLGVVFATSNEEINKILAHPLATEGKVAPVASLGECFELCVDVHGFLRNGAWAADQSSRTRATSAVLAAALSPARAPLSWHVVEGIATRLLEYVSYDSRAGWELAFSRAVALRHQGTDALLDWPETLEERPIAEQWTILAHVVQSAADGDLERAETYAKAAIEALSAGTNEASEDGPTQLARWRLRGAIGRALAAMGRYEAAGGHLEACIAHWGRVGPRKELSFPLCEALRIAGLTHDEASLTALRTQADDLIAEGDADGYVRLALGRALIQADQPREAAALLRPVVDATAVPDHVHAAACRWLVKASIAAGAWTEAAQTRATLEGLVPLPDQTHLARLDEALRQGDLDASRRALEGLLTCGPLAREARRTLTRIRASTSASDETTVLARLADEYRY